MLAGARNRSGRRTNVAVAQSQSQPRGEVWSLNSLVNTKREYEAVIILRPDTSKTQISDLIARIQKMFGEYKGTLLKIDSWGMRVLAYPVAKQRKGIYLYWRFLGGSDIVAEFERLMKLSDRVIRVVSFKVDADVDPAARPSEVTEELLDAVAEPGPDPDEVARLAAEAEAERRAAEQAVAAAAAAAAEAAREAARAAGTDSDDDDNDDDEEDEEDEG
jgi:small subunit ribosomal protein S6